MEIYIDMNINIDLNKIIKPIFLMLLLTLIAFFINTILFFYLPKAYYPSGDISNYNIKFNKYYIKESFSLDKKVEQKKIEPKKKEYQILLNIVLKAIYKTQDNSGWIIIAEHKSNKTSILSIGDNFKGFVLKYIFIKYVIFEKNNVEYKLLLNNKNDKIKYEVTNDNKTIESISDTMFSIPRDTINSYTNNIDKIWKEIGISEIRYNGAITGFKVVKIKKNSVFSKIGLKKLDIIKSVNNIELKSYADAFKAYEQIDDISNLSITVIRNNQEMELEYEIK
jgi:general secretion pathway protein C